MVLGNLVSHFERTKLDSYLMLFSKVTSRWWSITPKYETIIRKLWLTARSNM